MQRIDKELASAISQLDSEKEDALKNLDEQVLSCLLNTFLSCVAGFHTERLELRSQGPGQPQVCSLQDLSLLAIAKLPLKLSQQRALRCSVWLTLCEA